MMTIAAMMMASVMTVPGGPTQQHIGEKIFG
jgi:hypothetical protein